LATILEDEFSRLGLPLPKNAEEKLAMFIRELEHWNRVVNLTSLSGVGLVRRLIAEPNWIGEKLQMSGVLVDVGSGNGAPGIPLGVVRGLERVDLVEPRGRRAAFLRHIAKQLGSDTIFVHKVRLENMNEPPSRVDWVTFQGLDPSTLMDTLRRLFDRTTNVVWITSKEITGPRIASLISVPGSNTVAWVFQLDQF
jgi:16S rRNA G527 N7-methylase RsmG